MNTACSPVVRVRFFVANLAQNECNTARTTARSCQTQIDQALLALWSHLFALYEAHNDAPAHLHGGTARAHAVALFDPTRALGDAGWPHVRTITFHSAPALTTFVFAVEFVGDGTPLLFTVAQAGAAFRVQGVPRGVAWDARSEVMVSWRRR